MKTPPHQSTLCVHCHSRPHRRRFKVLAALAAAALSLLPLGDAWAQSDNFNDGNDTGWFRYDPIASAVPGGIATYTLANGTYRIQTAPCPAPAKLGPGRAGSLRRDVTYTDFYITVDVVAWNPALDQVFGIMARVENIGLGQTTGYSMTWAQDGPDLDISRITGEDATGVTVSGNEAAPLVPGHSYRFVFIGKGPVLTGRVYDLADLTTPLAEITGSDGAYSSGVCGLVVYDNTSAGSGTTDATFDNYVALPEEPPQLKYTYFADSLEFEVTWPVTYTGYVLESSPVLPATTWTELGATPRQDVYFYMEDASPGTGNKFFRLRKPWPPGGAR